MEVVVSCFMFLLISIIFIKERMHIINNDFNIKDKEILNKKDFFSYTLKLFTSQSLKAGNKKIDNIILGWLMSPLEVSFYDVIKKLFVPINILIQPLRQIYFPKIVKSFNDNRIKEVNKLIIYNSKVLLLISVAFIILLISFKDFLYDLFELESNYNLNFMFFSYVIVSMYLPLFWWVRILSNSVNPMYSLYSNGISTIIICGVSIPMISYFGLIGLGISLISNVFFQVIFWYTKYRKHIISNIITS
jgi:O-antigen/teichoic acid export membrane protein